jgi:sarcosine/dimethylglycine N-methyltransferase
MLQEGVAMHYSQATGGDVLAAVLSALEATGKDIGALRYEDLGSVDHFHGGALEATRMLAELGNLSAGERVLDMGGGFGGPARTLAAEYGCHVTVLDPIPAFVEAGRALTQRVGLQDAVQFYLGSGLCMSVADASFDVVWTQNASMNIPDKRKLAGEQSRILRPGGRLVFQELFAGPGGEAILPTPWAREASANFLVLAEDVRRLPLEEGFVEQAWIPPTPQPLQAVNQTAGPTMAAVSVVHGPDTAAMDAATRRNMAEQRVIGVRAVFVKSS